MASMDVWVYSQTTWTQSDLTGFSVEAIDGSIGKVDEASNATDASYDHWRAPGAHPLVCSRFARRAS